MTVVNLVTCVRPTNLINHKRLHNRIQPLLQNFPEKQHAAIIQACKTMLHTPQGEPAVVAWWGFSNIKMRDDVLEIMLSLGIQHFFAAHVQEGRFECVCWVANVEALTKLFECFQMSIDHVTLDVAQDNYIFETALQRITRGMNHNGIQPDAWPESFQIALKVGVVRNTTKLEFTPENFLNMHTELRRAQQRAIDLYDRNITQELTLRNLRRQYTESLRNVRNAMDLIENGHHILHEISNQYQMNQTLNGTAV